MWIDGDAFVFDRERTQPADLEINVETGHDPPFPKKKKKTSKLIVGGMCGCARQRRKPLNERADNWALSTILGRNPTRLAAPCCGFPAAVNENAFVNMIQIASQGSGHC